MRVFIHSFEYMYEGLYGIENYCVCDVNSLEEANEIGHEMAWQVFEDFIDYDDYLDENGDIDYKRVNEELGWVIYKIKNDITLSETELDEIACRVGVNSFINNYCEEIEEIDL